LFYSTQETKKNYQATIASNTQNLQKTGKRGKEREDRTHPQQKALLLRKKAPLAIIIIITLSRSHHKPNYCRYTHAMSETRTTNPLICSQALSAETNRTCVAVAHHLLLLLLIIIIIPSKQQPSSKLSPTQQQQQTTLPPPPFYKNFNKKKTHETTSTPFLLSLS